MTEVYRHQYMTRYYHENWGIMEGKWTDNGAMTDSDYRNIMLGTLVSTNKYKPYGILIDTRQFHLCIVPATQEWVQANVFLKAREAGLKKVAFVLPKSVFVETSIDQTMHINGSIQIFDTRFFSDYDKAFDWVIQKS